MRTSMIGAALLLAGAGAAGLAAAAPDTNGNGLQLNGSDTLFDVTRSIISTCNTKLNNDNTGGDTYLGGGSGVGAGQMLGSSGVASQAISPMSRALKNSEFCGLSVTAYGGTVPESQSATEGLLVGIDGVSEVANQTNSCSTGGAANGLGHASMSIQTGGTGTTTGTYTFGSGIYAGLPSFDALSVLYFGLTNDGVYNCASDTRKSLIANWKNLFSTDCGAGDGTCSAGLTHAWRRSDLSGTTDAFVSVINPSGRGIGTLSTAPVGATTKVNPFCNSADANGGPATFGGSADFSDLDPVRTVCGASGAVDDVCESYKFQKVTGLFNGDLGVVLPVLIPDASTTVSGDIYPTQACSNQNFCALVAPIKINFLDPNYLCPGSNLPPNQGFCYMPVIDNVGNDPRCVSAVQQKCFDVTLKPDGRQYNLPVVVNASQFVAPFTKFKSTTPYQFAIDVNNRPLAGSFFRIHSHQPGLHNVPDPTAGSTGICQENDDTSQIGCLVDSDPCSLGYAGREAAKAYPGVGSPALPTSEPFKALAIDGVTPFTPDAIAIAATGPFATGLANPDLGLQNLIAPPGTLPLYPLARRLYFATTFGFSNLQGGEKELAQCYGTNSITGPAISGHGFVAVPTGVSCLDYPETRPTAAAAPNVQGSGNAALGGCAAGSNGNACANFPPKDINGVTVPEATETF